jgi:glycosyltransferase involved in cell wall biosynthesis
LTGRRRLWVVTELYHPERTSTGRSLTGIAEGLADRFDVHALCAQPTYAARGVQAPAVELLNEVHVRRCASTRFDKDHLFGRVCNLVTVTASIGWQALRRFRGGDRVLVVTNPPLLPFVVLLASRLRGARPVLLIHDVYPDVLVSAGLIRKGSLATRVGARVARWLYRRFERVVVLGRDMESLVRNRIGGEANGRIALIPNWADLDQISARPKAASGILDRLGIEPDAFVIQYLGNMGRTHGIEDLVDVAASLRDDRIVFLFVGQGARLDWVREQISLRDLAHCRVVGGVPDEELADYLNACDLSVITLRPGMAGVSVPSRLYNVLAAGRALLVAADPEAEVARTVAEENIGWVVPPGDPASLRRTILEVARRRETVRERGQRARKVAEARYTREVAVEAYLGLFEALG